jgi:hypothetical protein
MAEFYSGTFSGQIGYSGTPYTIYQPTPNGLDTVVFYETPYFSGPSGINYTGPGFIATNMTPVGSFPVFYQGPEGPPYSGNFAGSRNYAIFFPDGYVGYYAAPRINYSGTFSGSRNYSGNYLGTGTFAGPQNYSGFRTYSGNYSGTGTFAGPQNYSGFRTYSGNYSGTGFFTGPANYSGSRNYSGNYLGTGNFDGPQNYAGSRNYSGNYSGTGIYTSPQN